MNEDAEELAARVRRHIGLLPAITEVRMFGGLALLLDGNMVAAVMGDGSLLARTGKEGYAAALGRLGASPMTMGTRRMGGFVQVEGEGIESDADLGWWIDGGLRIAAALPPKSA